MSDAPPSLRRRFWKSRHHLWLAVLTLGLGFASGQPLGLLAGATLYAIGLVFLPDSRLFRRSVEAQLEAERERAAAEQLAAFQREAARVAEALSSGRRARHGELVAVCQDIERASRDAQSATGPTVAAHLRKLDDLKWTYLRMLSVEQALEVFLETERKEQVPLLVKSIEDETRGLASEIEGLRKSQPGTPLLEARERLLTSRLERGAALRQRLARIQQAQANFELIRAEQERLVDQVKLIRAEAVAARNADALSSRIDSSIEHLSATNRWLSEIDEFNTLTAELPPLPSRLPLDAPVATPAQARRNPPLRQ